MAKQIINVGTTANDGTGDTLRVSQQKANNNFDDLYEDGGANITVNNPVTSTETSLDDALSDISAGGGGSTPTIQQVLNETPRTFTKTEGDFTYQLSFWESGAFSGSIINDVTGATTDFLYADGGFSSVDDDGAGNTSTISNESIEGFKTQIANAFGANIFNANPPRTTSGNAVISVPSDLPTGDYEVAISRYKQAFIKIIPDAGAIPDPLVNLIVAGDFNDGEFTTTWDIFSHFYLNSTSGLFIESKTIYPQQILFADGGMYSGQYTLNRIDDYTIEFFCNDYNGDQLALVQTQLTIVINN